MWFYSLSQNKRFLLCKQGLRDLVFCLYVCDFYLKFITHSHLSQVVFAVSVLRQTCSTQTILTVYRGYFDALLRYGVAFWGNSVLSESIFKVQKRILRCVFNLRKRDSCKDIFKSANILTLPSLYILETLIITYSNKDNLQNTGGFHNISTRHGDALRYPVQRTTFF